MTRLCAEREPKMAPPSGCRTRNPPQRRGGAAYVCNVARDDALVGGDEIERVHLVLRQRRRQRRHAAAKVSDDRAGRVCSQLANENVDRVGRPLAHLLRKTGMVLRGGRGGGRGGAKFRVPLRCERRYYFLIRRARPDRRRPSRYRRAGVDGAVVPHETGRGRAQRAPRRADCRRCTFAR